MAASRRKGAATYIPPSDDPIDVAAPEAMTDAAATYERVRQGWANDRELLEAALELLVDMVDVEGDVPCRLDHDGYCQDHPGGFRTLDDDRAECWVAAAKALVARIRAGGDPERRPNGKDADMRYIARGEVVGLRRLDHETTGGIWASVTIRLADGTELTGPWGIDPDAPHLGDVVSIITVRHDADDTT